MNISLSNETKKELNRIIGNLQIVSGKKYSYDEAVNYILQNSITLDKEMVEGFKKIRDFYNLSTNEEASRLMLIRFIAFIKEMKEKGYDKFSLIP